MSSATAHTSSETYLHIMIGVIAGAVLMHMYMNHGSLGAPAALRTHAIWVGIDGLSNANDTVRNIIITTGIPGQFKTYTPHFVDGKLSRGNNQQWVYMNRNGNERIIKAEFVADSAFVMTLQYVKLGVQGINVGINALKSSDQQLIQQVTKGASAQARRIDFI